MYTKHRITLLFYIDRRKIDYFSMYISMIIYICILKKGDVNINFYNEYNVNRNVICWCIDKEVIWMLLNIIVDA